MKYLALSTLSLAISSLSVQAEEFRQHDSHTHGAIEFNIAQDGEELLIEILAPAADVIGFEHAPRNEQEKAALQKALTSLEDPSTVLTFAQAGQCSLEHKSVKHSLDKHDEHHGEHDHDKHDEHHDEHDHDKHDEHHGEHDHDKHDEHHDEHDHDKHDGHNDEHDHDKHDEHHDEHDHDKHEKSTHSAFTIEYHFECKSIKNVDEAQAVWFKSYPSTQKITVNIFTDNVQTSKTLTAKENRFAL
ncbi:DUF2796 domain-containing protein [Vibrio sp.]|nr:DUF2796 domain-containing protein [Vibrio sp.]